MSPLRIFPVLAALLLTSAACAQTSATTPAPDAPAPMTERDLTKALTAETQAAMTPRQVIQLLKDGNQRFLDGTPLERNFMAQVRETSEGQFPMAAILGCIDSRVPHEIVFDKGVGDVFSARVAGNFVNTDILGSLEFATAAAGAKVIVVLGHTSCGAVKGACDGVELGNLTSTLANISPAIYRVGDSIEGEQSSSNKAYVEAVAHANVELTVRNMVERSRVLYELVESGDLIIVGAMHDVASGRVEFYEDSMLTAETLDG